MTHIIASKSNAIDGKSGIDDRASHSQRLRIHEKAWAEQTSSLLNLADD